MSGKANIPYISCATVLFTSSSVWPSTTYRKLWERMNAAETFKNSTEEGYGTARRVQNAAFMAEKPLKEYAIMQKPCDLRTGIA